MGGLGFVQGAGGKGKWRKNSSSGSLLETGRGTSLVGRPNRDGAVSARFGEEKMVGRIPTGERRANWRSDQKKKKGGRIFWLRRWKARAKEMRTRD